MNLPLSKSLSKQSAIDAFGLFALIFLLIPNPVSGGELIDAELSQWEVWTGVPHPSVKELPEGYSRGDDPKKAPPIGMGDFYGIFSTKKEEDGSFVLRVSGESRAALTTKASYSDYHLSLQFKWGELGEAPKRDSGLLYHCTGPHGAMWNNWKRCLELQIQEGVLGDLYLLGGFGGIANLDNESAWDPSGEGREIVGNPVARIAGSKNAESPLGEWTRIDVYALGDSAIHVINGKVVAVISRIELEGERITSGQLQLQSGTSECFFKDISIRYIDTFPNEIAAQK